MAVRSKHCHSLGRSSRHVSCERHFSLFTTLDVFWVWTGGRHYLLLPAGVSFSPSAISKIRVIKMWHQPGVRSNKHWRSQSASTAHRKPWRQPAVRQKSHHLHVTNSRSRLKWKSKLLQSAHCTQTISDQFLVTHYSSVFSPEFN